MTPEMLQRVGTWLIILLLGYAIASMQDRYTGAQAVVDRKEMIAHMHELLGAHVGRGHGDIEARVIKLEVMLETLIHSVDFLKNRKEREEE